jgi:hypothetical protein
MTKSEQNARWYRKNARRIKVNRRKQYADDPEFRRSKILQAQKRYAADPEEQKARSRKSTLARYFGMTVEKYEAQSKAQNHECLICGRTASEADPRRKDLCVDHDHSCCPGAKSCGLCVRGLICSQCNSGLGHFRDDLETILAAAAYIQSHKQLKVAA